MRKEFTLSLIVLIFVLAIFSRFVQYVELRQGIQLNDFFLNTFTAINLTWPIFIMIYGAIIAALVILVFDPIRLMILFEAYSMMVLIRIVLMYFVALEPPTGMILLRDPLVELFGGTKTLTKDLFFSGHTASLTLLTMAVPKKAKWFFFTLTLLVAVGVLWQKVHYTIDVLVAPIVAIFCYYMTSRRHKKLVNE
jgi:membrane-associated phospholipid phosphatase